MFFKKDYRIAFTAGTRNSEYSGNEKNAERLFVGQSYEICGKHFMMEGIRFPFYPHHPVDAQRDLEEKLTEAEHLNEIDGVSSEEKKKMEREYAKELYIKAISYRALYFRSVQNHPRAWVSDNSSKNLSSYISTALMFAENYLDAEERIDLEKVLTMTFTPDAPRYN